MEQISEADSNNVGGGFSNVSEPVYSLTEKEAKVLKGCNYTLKKTGSGNYKVFYANGCSIEPHVLENMCKVVNYVSDNNWRL